MESIAPIDAQSQPQDQWHRAYEHPRNSNKTISVLSSIMAAARTRRARQFPFWVRSRAKQTRATRDRATGCDCDVTLFFHSAMFSLLRLRAAPAALALRRPLASTLSSTTLRAASLRLFSTEVPAAPGRKRLMNFWCVSLHSPFFLFSYLVL